MITLKQVHNIDMRDAFFEQLFDIAKKDRKVILLTADMGALSLEKFKKELKNQYFNVGIAEQNMVSIAAGLALGGKKVFIYTIIPFATFRCFEQIKIDLCCMNLPVTIVGVGPGFAYGSDGPTHHATQDIAVMRTLPEITIFNPADPVSTFGAALFAYRSKGPVYVRIDKGIFPLLYPDKADFKNGLAQLKKGNDLTLISTGIMTHTALKVAERLKRKLRLATGVIDLYRIKPLNKKYLLTLIKNSRRLVTLEENSIIGGIGSMLSELLSDNNLPVPLKRIAIPDEHCFKLGDRNCLHEACSLDEEKILDTIKGA